MREVDCVNQKQPFANPDQTRRGQRADPHLGEFGGSAGRLVVSVTGGPSPILEAEVPLLTGPHTLRAIGALAAGPVVGVGRATATADLQASLLIDALADTGSNFLAAGLECGGTPNAWLGKFAVFCIGDQTLPGRPILRAGTVCRDGATAAVKHHDVELALRRGRARIAEARCSCQHVVLRPALGAARATARRRSASARAASARASLARKSSHPCTTGGLSPSRSAAGLRAALTRRLPLIGPAAAAEKQRHPNRSAHDPTVTSALAPAGLFGSQGMRRTSLDQRSLDQSTGVGG